MRNLILILLVFTLSGCAAMMLGGSGSNTSTQCDEAKAKEQGREC